MTEFERQLIEQLKELNKNLSSLGVAGFSPAPVLMPKSKYTYFQWLDMWFKEFKSPALKDSGYDLLNTINKHLKPNITDKPLNEFDGVEIQQALNKIESSKMRQIVYGIFRQSFDKAESLGYITSSPIKKIERPKHITIQGRALSLDEQKLFLYESKKSELSSLFWFYILTGCRKNEALSIKWEHINSNSIFINGTKTKNAVREFPIYPQLAELLAAIPKINNYVFPYTSDKVRYEFERIRKRLDFKDFTIHDLRHTFATRCVESGVKMLTIQKWLGHSDYTTTANIYSHITTHFEQEQISLFSKNIVSSRALPKKLDVWEKNV